MEKEHMDTKKRRKLLVAVLLLLALAAIAVALFAIFYIPPPKSGQLVFSNAGVQCSDEDLRITNTGTIWKGKGFEWDTATSTLVLSRFAWDTTAATAVLFDSVDATIVLNGDSAVVSRYSGSGASCAVRALGSLEIVGPGTLQVSGGNPAGKVLENYDGSYGLFVTNGLSVKEGSVIALGGSVGEDMEYGRSAGIMLADTGSLQILGGTVTATGGTADYSEGISIVGGDVVIAGGTVTATGSTAQISSSGLSVYRGKLHITGGQVEARGGNAYDSSGIYVANLPDADAVLVGGGDVIASGDKANEEHGISEGIAVIAGNMHITGGKIVSNAGDAAQSNGIFVQHGNLEVRGGVTEAVAGLGTEISYGIMVSPAPGKDRYQLRHAGGTLTAVGKTSAYHAQPESLPASYGYWASEAGTDAGGSCTLSSEKAYEHTGAQLFVKIQSSGQNDEDAFWLDILNRICTEGIAVVDNANHTYVPHYVLNRLIENEGESLRIPTVQGELVIDSAWISDTGMQMGSDYAFDELARMDVLRRTAHPIPHRALWGIAGGLALTGIAALFIWQRRKKHGQ